jgi:subtilisin-like proprotein convertase family protein
MKKQNCILLLLLLSSKVFAQVGINATGAAPASSAMLDVSSTSKGLLIPRMTTAQKNAIVSPTQGLMVYDTNIQQYSYWNSSAWVNLPSTLSGGQWTTSGSDIFNNNAGNVKISNLTGTGNRLVFAKSDGSLVTPTVNVGNTVYPQVPIVDNNCVAPSSSILISGGPSSFKSSNITVQVDITHTFNGDVVCYLQAPTGQILNLLYFQGSSGQNFYGTVFSDNASGFLSGTAPFTGNFKPTGNLNTICGATSGAITPTVTTFGALGSGGFINPNGTWTLYVKDLVSGLTGTFNDWTIHFDNPDNVISTPLIFDQTVANRKLVLYDVGSNNNEFYGFGVNAAGLLRYQVWNTAADHVFYAGQDASTSNELMRLKGTGNVGIGTSNPTATLDVNGSIKTKYSGTIITTPPGTGNQLFNLNIPVLPAGWDVTNTVVLVSIADGGYGQIGQAKILNSTTLEIRENVSVAGATRYNYVIFRL